MKDYKCRGCTYIASSAGELAGHLGRSNHDTPWAKSYRTRQANKTSGGAYKDGYEYFKNKYKEATRRPYETSKSIEPVQKQIIRFFSELYEKQNMGFNDNEILTMLNIAKRQAKVEVKN